MSGPFLGFDFGLKRVGVAVGSHDTDARPLATARNGGGGPDWHLIDALIREWTPTALVVGVPYNADGSPHAVTVAAESFAAELAARHALPVHTVDERYSSVEAEGALAERRRRGDHRRVRRGDVDAAAAAVILSDWLAGGPDR